MTRILTTTALALALSSGMGLAQSQIDLEGAAFAEDGVTFANVVARNPGYLVVTERLPEGAPASDAEAIGYAPVTQGDNPDLRVEGDFEPGAPYTAILFDETNDQDDFQWGENVDLSDTPSMNDGMPVMTNFDMVLESGQSGG